MQCFSIFGSVYLSFLGDSRGTRLQPTDTTRHGSAPFMKVQALQHSIMRICQFQQTNLNRIAFLWVCHGCPDSNLAPQQRSLEHSKTHGNTQKDCDFGYWQVTLNTDANGMPVSAGMKDNISKADANRSGFHAPKKRKGSK